MSIGPAPAVWVALLTAVASIVGACTTMVPGAPVSAVDGPQMVVDPTLLDVGPYPTTPRPALGTAGTHVRGVLVEAQRMANFVVGPWEVDTALKVQDSFGARVLTDADALTTLGPPELAAVSGRHNFINGFASARQAENGKSLLNAVLRFGDPPSAAAAVSDLRKTKLTEPSNWASPQQVSIPGHPEALAISYTVTDSQKGRQWIAMRSFAFHGPYVLAQVAVSVGGPAPAARLVANVINRQRVIIDQFPATDPADFAEIALDPTGLLARTLLLPPDQATTVQNARFGKRGALHFQNDPIWSSALFDDTVMDLTARAKTNIYRLSDAYAALLMVDEFTADIQASAGKLVDRVEFMPASQCMQVTEGFYCVAPVDRYVIEARSPSLEDAHQQVAAQYILLLGH
ncbi:MULTISPECIES: DUF7373 family lipoprotein [Mycolicibacterium]|uniref:Uncharacterized protein n=3 Tax=Mycolicibacterium TaxID=1866885 RepID=A0A0J6ZEW2_9MYCO|nr:MULTISPECIES: hypothetical protein [Mycolicibacterium]ADU01937.1 hypothetical protein Mspyr1_54240 [Mycolicibacterium gilvum Spyr1]KMO83336.1 hypothetical protein MCHLDSM_00532 [Mycolicibacterium chlorophenolicum]MCV7155720.1 hypothetical protein [Mycolicibacterium pyrenivorans]MDN4519658.1 hypothetical protein [Mycolicibacterium austroafricanum]